MFYLLMLSVNHERVYVNLYTCLVKCLDYGIGMKNSIWNKFLDKYKWKVKVFQYRPIHLLHSTLFIKIIRGIVSLNDC